MKKFDENHLDWSAEKKERKIKKHRSDEACKCFAPFLKLHWHDCPMVNKPCPIHGINFDYNSKEEKEEPEQNVTISFYPSSKTERLFQPVKHLLAQCNPETKINLQYFSPRDFSSKNSFKHQLIQTSSEDLKTAINKNFFVEKSKSFTTDKTNKMKKLKQCFHSPCNSIAKKSRSQVSFRQKMNEIFRDESQHRNAFFNMNLEEPRDDVKNCSSFGWFSPSKTGLENFEKLSDEKKDSDFITFTQRAKNNVINHKIFEIKHKKGLNDFSKVKIFKEPTQFVYTSFASKTSVKEPPDTSPGNKNDKVFDRKQLEKDVRRDKHETSSVSANSQTSSSGSVYVTPFFLMPNRADDSDSDRPSNKKVDEVIQTQGSPTEKRQCLCSKDRQTGIQQSSQNESEKDQSKTISLQTEPIVEEKHSQCTKEIFLHDYEPSMETVNDKLVDDMTKVAGEDLSDDGCWQRKCYEIIREERESSKYTKTIEVQTSNNYRYKEVCVSTRCDRSIRDQTSQTETTISETRRRIYEPSPTNKYQVSQFPSKEVQTECPDNVSDSDTSKIMVSESSESEKIRRELENISNEPTRSWWKKSFSDSELFDKKKSTTTKVECPNLLSQNCCCKGSNVTHGSGAKEYGLPNTSTKVFETHPQTQDAATNYCTLPTQVSIEHVSKAEQTSLVEDDCADLSELKKIIQQFFEKRDPNSGKKQDGGSPRANENKVDRGIMTESLLCLGKQDPKNTIDMETQTTVHVLMDDAMEENHTKLRGQRVKFRQSVLLDDENQTKTFFICALCGREISKYSVNASTNTDNLSSHPKVKEKMTVVDTEIKEVITVKTLKKSQNVDASTAYPKLASKQSLYPPPDNSAKMLKSSHTSPRALNFQRSCIPILISGPGSAHLRYDETITVSENLNPTESPENLNKKCIVTAERSKPQNPRSSQNNCQCINNDAAGPSESRTSKTSYSTTTKAAKPKEPRPKTDIYPSLPKVEHPGVENSQWRNERSSIEKGNNRKTDGYFYPVLVNSFWPKEFMRTWKSMEKYDKRLSISSNQKRSYEKDVEKGQSDIPVEKKIKPFFDESSKECFVFGKSSFSNVFKKEKNKTPLAKNTGFIWVPSSSVPQMSSRSNNSHQFKTTKSEELLKIARQQDSPTQVEKFAPNNKSEIFTVKSCHLKPIAFKKDEQSFSRLLECSFCKSFTFLKTDKKDETRPKSNISYQPNTQERNPNELIPEEPTHDRPLQCEEEFHRECSHFFDDNDVPESLENNVSEEEIVEVLEETYSDSDCQGTELQTQSHIGSIFENPLNFETATISKSLNTFWFDGDSKKKFAGNAYK